tara:strand:+ start:5450 stop:5803 length:354 start_codon:yes stop_codon:yes gene_type:complete
MSKYDGCNIEIIESRLATEDDGVPNELLPFKPVFMKRNIIREWAIYLHNDQNNFARQESSIIYPVCAVLDSGDVIEPTLELSGGCAVTYEAIEQHRQQYWNDGTIDAHKNYIESLRD